MNTAHENLSFALIVLALSSCASLTGRVPAAQLKNQLKLEISSLTVTDNKATVTGGVTASERSTFIEDIIHGPSLLVTKRNKGSIESFMPVRLIWSYEDELSHQKRVSLEAGESDKFRLTIQLAEELSYDRKPIPGKLYLSDDNGISGYLVEPYSEFQMEMINGLSDYDNRSFVLTADKVLLFTIVNGQLDIELAN